MKQAQEELQALKNEVKEIEQDGFALEILKDYKKDNIKLEENNKRLFIIIIVLILCWFITGAYLVYLLNDIGVSETTTTETYDQDINDTGDIDNSTINNGGVINGTN